MEFDLEQRPSDGTWTVTRVVQAGGGGGAGPPGEPGPSGPSAVSDVGQSGAASKRSAWAVVLAEMLEMEGQFISTKRAAELLSVQPNGFWRETEQLRRGTQALGWALSEVIRPGTAGRVRGWRSGPRTRDYLAALVVIKGGLTRAPAG